MKPRLARRLVKAVSYCMDRSYRRWVLRDLGLTRFEWPESAWAWGFRRLSPLLRLATWFDRDNAVDQMACEGWWG